MGWLTKIAVCAGLYEGAAAWTTQRERKRAFKAAQERALTLNRPLLVVGDPSSGFVPKLFPAYGCGDVCLDLHGCTCPDSVAADVTRPIPFGDDSAVVFVSCVLEYVEDVGAAWGELRRVAGDRSNLFVVTVPTWSFASWIFPGARWKLYEREDGTYEAVAVNGLIPGDGQLLGV